MANPTQLQVLIDIQAKLDQLDQSVQQMLQLKSAVQQVNTAAGGGFGELFKLGETIDLTHRLNDLITEAPRTFAEWVQEGVKFNAEIEKSQVGIAAMLRQFDPQQFATFHDAMKASGPTLDLLREKALQLGVSFPGLAEQYQSTIGAMFAAGVRDIQKQIDLTVLLRQATQALPFGQNVIQRDLVDILQGAPRAAMTDVGRSLGIDEQALNQAREAGTLVEYLTQKLSGFREATAAASDTFSASEQRMETELQILKGDFAADLFAEFKAGLKDINALLSDEGLAESVRGAGAETAAVFASLVESAVGWKNALKEDIATLDDVFSTIHLGSADLEKDRDALVNLFSGVGIDLNFFKDQYDTGAAEKYLSTEEKRLQKLQQEIAAADTLHKQDVARADLNNEINRIEEKQVDSTGTMRLATADMLDKAQQLSTQFAAIAGHAKDIPGALQQSAAQLDAMLKASNALLKAEEENVALGAKASGDLFGAAAAEAQIKIDAFRKALTEAHVDPAVANTQVEIYTRQITDSLNEQAFKKQELARLDEQSVRVQELRAAGEDTQADREQRDVDIYKEFLKLDAEHLRSAADSWALAVKNVDAGIHAERQQGARARRAKRFERAAPRSTGVNRVNSPEATTGRREHLSWSGRETGGHAH
jgi:hypothetical protein